MFKFNFMHTKNINYQDIDSKQITEHYKILDEKKTKLENLIYSNNDNPLLYNQQQSNISLNHLHQQNSIKRLKSKIF